MATDFMKVLESNVALSDQSSAACIYYTYLKQVWRATSMLGICLATHAVEQLLIRAASEATSS